MRATRAYLAGIGTAGALALGAALVFAAASAIIAFRGWPGADSSTGPARQVVSVTPPPSPVARRLAQIATTAKRPAVAPHHPAASGVTRIAARHRATTVTRVHHRGHAVTPTQHRTATTPVVTRHRAQRVHRAGVHTRHTEPLHSKSYPASTPTAPTATTAAATTPTATAPTVTVAVTTASTTTPTATVGITVPTGRGHSVTITTATTPTITTPTGPINIRPVTNTTTETTTVTTTPTLTGVTTTSR